jgi:hypothetical protein
MAACMVMVGVGFLSVAVAHLVPEGPWVIAAGPVYGSIGFFQWRVGKHYDRLRAAAAPVAGAAAQVTVQPTPAS